VEASIDLRCEFSSTLTVDDLERVRASLSDAYPIREELMELRAEIAPGGGVTSAQRVAGVRALSSLRSKVAGLGLEGFTFSWLAPYDHWEALRDEASRIWELYAGVTNPSKVVRIGVRFINRLDLPNPDGAGVDLDRYLRTAPRIAPELPQHLESFFLRFQLLLGGSPPARMTITETGVQPAGPDVVSILLDIDAFVQGVEVAAPAAWEILERLRHEKNSGFEWSITDAARLLIS
jgi:uncharacterized protein (TIGR04255 family)